MKFKEQIGSRYIFDGGYGEELEATMGSDDSGTWIKYLDIVVWPNMYVQCFCERYKDIQTAVNLMQILKDEGVV